MSQVSTVGRFNFRLKWKNESIAALTNGMLSTIEDSCVNIVNRAKFANLLRKLAVQNLEAMKAGKVGNCTTQPRSPETNRYLSRQELPNWAGISFLPS